MTDLTTSPGESAPETISPELALVTPELRERARALLPDRPWEALAPPSAELPDPIPSRPVLSPAPDLTPGTVGPPAKRARHRIPRALLAPAVVALVFAAIAWASEQTPDTSFLQSSPGDSRVPTPVAAPPVPSGGYVFGDGALVADAQGAKVTLTLWRGCASGSGTHWMPVVAGRFVYTGPARERPNVYLSVEGRFADLETATLTMRLRGARCALGTRTVTARLS